MQFLHPLLHLPHVHSPGEGGSLITGPAGGGGAVAAPLPVGGGGVNRATSAASRARSNCAERVTGKASGIPSVT